MHINMRLTIKRINSKIDRSNHNKESSSFVPLNLRIIENNNYKKLSEEKLSKVESKDKIDSTIFTLNPSKLEEEIEIIVNTGLKHKSDIELIDEELKNIGKVDFDEDTDFKLNKENKRLTAASSTMENVNADFNISPLNKLEYDQFEMLLNDIEKKLRL